MFVADVMLKKLARWLRIMGVEVEYPSSEEDDDIMELARAGGKTLLTMDRELFMRARKRKINAFLVPRAPPEEQIATILREFKLGVDDFPSKTLCPRCNGSLVEVGKKEVQDKVYRAIYEKHDDFWMCEKCGKVFWRGSHWEKINRMVAKVRKLSESQSLPTSST